MDNAELRVSLKEFVEDKFKALREVEEERWECHHREHAMDRENRADIAKKSDVDRAYATSRAALWIALAAVFAVLIEATVRFFRP